jgi:hypothetical protein
VIFELVKLRAFRDNIWMRFGSANVYRRIDDPRLRIDVDSRVAGWDDHNVFTQHIRNYSGRPIDVAMRREYQGDVLFRSRLNAKLHDFRTVELTTRVAPGEKKDLYHEVVYRQGYNTKQNRVHIESADVTR